MKHLKTLLMGAMLVASMAIAGINQSTEGGEVGLRGEQCDCRNTQGDYGLLYFVGSSLDCLEVNCWIHLSLEYD